MNLPKPKKVDSLERYWKRFAREQMPKGQTIHAKTRHTPKTGQNNRAVSFSIEGDCKGSLAEVMDLGLRLAQNAAEEGNESRAILILDRIESLPREYELKAKLAHLKGLNTQLKKSA